MARAYDPMLNDLPEKRDIRLVPHEKIKERCEIIKQSIQKLKFFKDGLTFDYRIEEDKNEVNLLYKLHFTLMILIITFVQQYLLLTIHN